MDAVLALREANPTLGPRMLAATLARQAATAAEREAVPSPTIISRLLRAKGLAIKPIGPKDFRAYPDERPKEPGTFTIDGWGPWHIRYSRLYLCTIQDRYTRLSLAVPASGGLLKSNWQGLTAEHWATAQVAAAAHLLPEGASFQRLYADNGIGMVPAGTTLPQGARAALSLGARLIFIPPGQPWRNGRLERFHWTMEKEYFRHERPSSVPDALVGLAAYLNHYNTERPHSALGYRAPADGHFYKPLSDLPLVEATPRLPRTEGIVECVRLVLAKGLVELWGRDGLMVSPLLAGQFVRVVFQVPGSGAPGRVIYHTKGQDVVVATFKHDLDAPARSSSEHLLCTAVRLVDFGETKPVPNQELDMNQVSNQRARVTKRRPRLEDALQEEADAAR
jgi:transposase InsO family protein